jgi:hypothetical protein
MLNNPTPPPPAGYPQAYAPGQPSPGTFAAPAAPPPPAPAYAGVGTTVGTPPPTPAGPPPAYKPFPNDPSMILQRVDRDRISASTEACHRHAIDPKRVASFIKRCKNGAHFPPVILFQQADGSLLLVDGLHRLAAFDHIGVKIISALVIEDLGQALVAGLRQNIPSNGKLRTGDDAMRSLCLLAHALGRKIAPEEAASLGLKSDDTHQVLPSSILSLSAPSPYSPTSTPKLSISPKRKLLTGRKKKAA